MFSDNVASASADTDNNDNNKISNATFQTATQAVAVRLSQ